MACGRLYENPRSSYWRSFCSSSELLLAPAAWPFEEQFDISEVISRRSVPASTRVRKVLTQAGVRRVGRIHRFFADLLDSYSLDEVVCPLQVICTLAVVLEEERGRIKRLFGTFNGDQQICLAHLLPRCAAHDNLPASILPDK